VFNPVLYGIYNHKVNVLLTDVTQANEESMTYKAKNNCKLLIVRSRCVTSVIKFTQAGYFFRQVILLNTVFTENYIPCV